MLKNPLEFLFVSLSWGGPPWSACDPLIALFTNKISSATRVQADPGIGRGPGVRPTNPRRSRFQQPPPTLL